jgi:hypothetical protein
LIFSRYDTRVLFQISILLAQLVLLAALFIFIFHRTARRISAYTDVPFVATSNKLLPKIADALEIQPDDVVYDLGCGDGRFMFYAAKRFPETRFIGIERNYLLVSYILVRKFLLGNKNISIRRQNLFNADFSDATKVYIYMLPEFMKKLSPQFPHARVASRAFKLSGKDPWSVVTLLDYPGIWNEDKLYIYEL